MKPVLAALVAVLSTTAARGAHAAEPTGDKVVSSIVVSAALGEKDRLAQVEATLRVLRPGLVLAPLEHAALWSFQMRWNGTALQVMGADEIIDTTKVVELIASTHAPSPAYRKVLLAAARVAVQSTILLTISDTAERLGAALEAQTAAVQTQNRTLNDLRAVARAHDEKLKAKVEGLNVIMAAMKDPATSPDRRERLATELAAGAEASKALAAQLETARTQMLQATERLQQAAANLEAAMHAVPLDPAQREIVARNDLELQRLRAIAQRLDAKPQLRPDQITVFPSGLR